VATELALPTADMTSSRIVRVASVPAGHPYVRRVSAAPGIGVLPDPPVGDPPTDVWWPPVVLSAAWIDEHRDEADLLHIHFGTESFAPGHLTTCIAAAHRAGWPVVFTVHDLDHPQLGDQAAYHRQLDELVSGADALITLTPGAADVIRERWAKESMVIPHPSLLPRAASGPDATHDDVVRIGVHLNDLRANVDGPGIVTALIETVAELRSAGIPAVAEVRMRHRVRDDKARDLIRDLCARADHTRLIEHERLSDQELAVALGGLDLCVLPYRHGTHSGWLELCWDLGVPVAVPDVGHYVDQHPDAVRVFDHRDHSSLTPAVLGLLEDDASSRAGSPARAHLVAQRRRTRAGTDAAAAAAHADLYRRLVQERIR